MGGVKRKPCNYVIGFSCLFLQCKTSTICDMIAEVFVCSNLSVAHFDQMESMNHTDYGEG